jgi:hypothetical protein
MNSSKGSQGALFDSRLFLYDGSALNDVFDVLCAVRKHVDVRECAKPGEACKQGRSRIWARHGLRVRYADR